MEPTKKSVQNTSSFTPSTGLKPELSSLPKELMDDIFSMLSEDEMKDTATTTKFWNEKSVEYVKSEHYLPRKLLAGWLIDTLSEEKAEQKDALQKAISETGDIENLPDIKSSTSRLEEKILDVLMGLKLSDLNVKFNSVNKQPKFEHLFALIPVYKEIETIENLPKDQRDVALSNEPFLLGKLVAFGHLAKAISLVKTINAGWHIKAAISNIVSQLNVKYLQLTENNQYNGQQHYDDAVKIMNLLNMKKSTDYTNLSVFESSEYFNIEQLVFLCMQLYKNNRLDNAIKFADKFCDKDIILGKMAWSQAQSDRNAGTDNAKAFEIIDKISDPNIKKYALYDIETLGKYNVVGSTNPGLRGF